MPAQIIMLHFINLALLCLPFPPVSILYKDQDIDLSLVGAVWMKVIEVAWKIVCGIVD